MNSLSGKYWPAHPKPLPEETVSSWLLRTIKANIGNQPIHRFCRLEFGVNNPIWTRDTDRNLNSEVMKVLSEKSGVALDEINMMLLGSYEGIVFEKHNQVGSSKWILPIGVYHRERKRFGQQWCPLCLKEDATPYYRRHWRMAFSSCCFKHGRLLRDRCYYCAAPCMPHRGNFLHCSRCNRTLLDQYQGPAESVAMQAEYVLRKRSIDGMTTLDHQTHINPIAYFDIWHQLLGVLHGSKRSAEFRHQITKLFGGISILESASKKNNQFEYLGPRDRHTLISMVSRIMSGWPFMLVGLSAESRVWSSCILKDMNPVRYELWKVAKNYLAGPITPRCYPTDIEMHDRASGPQN